MGIGFIVFLAIGLAMDCFAVSVTSGIATHRITFYQRLKMALLFGLFQGVMPFVGFLAGKGFAEQIQRIDHWLAFFILGFIGGKMIVEDVKSHRRLGGSLPPKDFFLWTTLITLSLATSIDALATGLIFVPFEHQIGYAMGIIGLCSFVFSLAGSYFGSYCHGKFNFRAELIGGIILIAIGAKILAEHIINCN
ncbi:MAG: manganese efflux pump [Bacteroidales bacterium]|nr:manganese efflux pump [Bacteroidales bacterium]